MALAFAEENPNSAFMSVHWPSSRLDTEKARFVTILGV